MVSLVRSQTLFLRPVLILVLVFLLRVALFLAFRVLFQQLLVEYLLSRQQDEAAACVKELDCSLFHHEIVKRAVKVYRSIQQGEEDKMTKTFRCEQTPPFFEEQNTPLARLFVYPPPTAVSVFWALDVA